MTLRVTRMYAEYAVNPLGLDEKRPRLYWNMESEEPDAAQTAYRVQVASSPESLAADRADLWDSGKVESDRSVHVVYDGATLRSERTYYWRVRVWDRQGRASDWSEDASWSMGLLSRSEWKASWIARRPDPGLAMQPSPYFRRSIVVDKPVRRALVYATALGVYELRVNGGRVGDAHFAPGWTDYDTRVQVQAYDIAEALRPGENVIGAIVGDGWYAGTVGFLGRAVYGECPFLLLQARVEYEDGASELIVTDGRWRTARGPIVYSDFIKGETYDARLELGDWDRPGYDDSAWEAPLLRHGYNGLLVSAVEPPIRTTETLKPVSVRKTASGSYIYDMGQNMVGWAALKVRGAPGETIELSHAEMLNPDRSLYLDNLRGAVQRDYYILKGAGEEAYEPHFTFHGFRYVEVSGSSAELHLDSLIGKAVHSDTPQAGTLETSDPMVNRLYSNITWGQRGNFLSVPTDCPQRDERLGWTGDAQIFARTAAYNRDVSRFFTKYMQDVADAQQPSGAFPDVAPDAGWIRHKLRDIPTGWFAPDNAGWGDAGIVIPWTLYLMYGDTRILERHYEAMARWVAYLEDNSEGLLRPPYANYGDWLSIDADTPKDVLATSYFAYSARLLSRIAGALGRAADRDRYASLFAGIAEAFRAAYVAPDGRIKGDTQTVYALALQFGLLSAEQRRSAAAHLIADIRRRGDRLSTGFLGVGYLLPALTDAGCPETAYTLLHQEAFPSWMYSIKHGATTIWERWDGWTEDKGFQSPGMNSFNHYSLGSVGEWMFRCMAGIEADPEQPGFKHTIVRPKPGGSLVWVKASYDTLYGRIGVAWERPADGPFKVSVTVPANTSATVFMPGGAASINGGRADDGEIVEGCRPLGESAGEARYRIGSGHYTFIGKQT